jgi:hypothetical protein
MWKNRLSIILMLIFDKLLNKRTITSPIFLKKFENDNRQLQDLNDLLEKVRSDKILLMPENDAYEPFMLYEDQFSIIWVAVGIIKN